MQTTLSKHLLLAALGTVALLSGCGAEQGTKGLIDYAKAQIMATSETSDPQNLGTAKLFTDDTAEPAEI